MHVGIVFRLLNMFFGKKNHVKGLFLVLFEYLLSHALITSLQTTLPPTRHIVFFFIRLSRVKLTKNILFFEVRTCFSIVFCHRISANA